MRFLLISAFALTLAAFSAQLIGSEVRAMTGPRNFDALHLVARSRTAAANPALSHRQQGEQLRACDDALMSWAARVAPAPSRLFVARYCAELAVTILRSTPTYSLAHLVRGTAALVRSDPELAQAALLRSWQTAPHEGWLAARRLRVAFAAMRLGVFDPLEQFEDDIQTVLASNQYHAVLVTFYFEQPDHRDWLVGTVEKTDVTLQRRFAASVRNHANG